MAVYLTEDSAADALQECINILQTLVKQRRGFGDIALRMEDDGRTGANIWSTIDGLLTDWGSVRSQVATEISAIPLLFKSRVKTGMPSAYHAATIVASDPINGGYGTIRVVDYQETTVSPFASVFNAGDRVVLTDCEASDFDGAWTLRYTPQALGSNVLVNTNFASNWLTTDWTVAGGFADHNTGNVTPLQQLYSAMSGVVDNAPYLLTFTVTDMTAGLFIASFDGAQNTRTITANGTYEVIVYTESGAALSFTPSTAFDGKISSPTLVPFTGLAFTGGIGLTTTETARDTSVIVTLQER